MKQWKRLAALSSAIVMAAATLTYFPNDTLQNIRLEISASADETSADETSADETSAATWTKTESDGLTWTLDADGTLNISGTGAMKDYDYDSNPSPADNNSNVKKVVINDGVTNIGDAAFYCCSSLTDITIPNSVTSIGASAFDGCSNLTSITIPDNVTSIGDFMFYGCSSLTSITIPDGVTSIGYYAFSDCSSLTSITIPDSITNIRNSAFNGCSNLTSITIPDNVTSIGDFTFYGCSNLTSITIPDSVTRIGNYAFEDCSSLTSITIPKSVTSIGDSAFDGCTSLTVYLENGSTLTSNDLGVDESKIVSYSQWNEDNLTWMLGEDGTLTISGTGAMKDYDSNDNPSPATQKKDSIKKVVIEDGVTSIGNYAFYDCKKLTSITIPGSVTSIGAYAFDSCSNLTSITIPGSVISIGNSAFSYTGLKSITIPGSVTSIGSSVFWYCRSLTSITIPDSVTSIGNYAFYECRYLTSITIPDSVISIGTATFISCSSLTSITISDSVTSIGKSAFADCTNLKTISLSCKSSLKKSDFGDQADLVSALHILTKTEAKTATCTEDGNKAYWTCEHCGKYFLSDDTNPETAKAVEQAETVIPASHKLTKVEAKDATCAKDGNKEYWTCEHCGKYFLSDDTNPETAKAVEQSETVIPALKHKNETLRGASKPDGTKPGYSGDRYCPDCDTVLEKGYTYWNEGNLTWKLDADGTLTISGTGAMKNYDSDSNPSPVSNNWDVEKIVIEDGVTSIGDCAFYDCHYLTSITIPNSVTSIGIRAFNVCRNLTNITIPDNVTSIGNYAFYYCENLTSVTIPNSVTSIGDFAFYNCRSLTSITIPDRVTSIGNFVFEGCKGLTSITIPDSITSIGDFAFSNCSDLTSITIPDRVTSIGNAAFDDCKGLTSITIPDSVTSIGNSAFRGCSRLTSITIPKNVTSIRNSVFENCSSLTDITIPDGVTSIGGSAFSYCRSLTSITIPDSVTSIGSYAFYKCTGLTSITIPDSVTSIGKYTFKNCTSLTSIKIPDSVTSIGEQAFVGCEGLTSIKIPDSVTSIGRYAFQNCSSLPSIKIPDSVTSIGDDAFSNCESLKTISLSCKSSLKKSDFGEQADLVSYTNQHLLTKTEAKDATCTEDGNIEYWTCKHCKKYFLSDDTNPETAKAVEQSETVILASHKLTKVEAKDATCTEDGNKEYWTCEHCKKYFLSDDTNPETAKAVELSETVIPALNHKNAITSYGASKPTETEPGYSGDRYCPDCNTVLEKGYTYWNEGNLTWKLYEDGTLTISGTGAMKNYNYNNNPSPAYKNSNVKKVVIEDGVTSIGTAAFSGCGLISITIPNSVTSIGSYAFSYCRSLTSITIPDSVTSIEDGTFSYCRSLTSITIPDSVTSIGSFAFNHCNSLQTISLGCGSALKRSDFGKQGDFVSYASHILKKTAAKAPTCTEDGNKEYWTCEHCGKYFLSDDTNPETAKAVEQAETVIPASHKLTKVNAKDATCAKDGNKAYWTCEHCKKYFLSDDTNPETAKAVELSETIIPALKHKNATTRGEVKPTEIEPGYSGDRYCPDCDTVLEKGYTYWNEGNLTWKLYEDGTLTISGTGTMKDYNAIDNRSPVRNNSKVKKVVIEDGVTNIGERAFYDCSSLTSITIPDSVTSIGTSAFNGCSSLPSITIPDSVTSIGNFVFEACNSLSSITLSNNITSIGGFAFHGCPLTSITIPDSVTSIGTSAFSYCRSLTSITIPDSVTSIGYAAFNSCDSLTSITIPDSVTSIGMYAFSECSSLTSITIPDSVTSIGRYAFQNCSSLKSITIPDSVTSIGDSAFYSCEKLTSITIPDSVTSIGDAVFSNCESLTAISLSCKSSLKKNDFGDQADLVSYALHTLKKTEAKTATCTEDGNIEYWTCEHCKKYFLSDDTNPETAKAVEQSETVIPASHKLTKVEAKDATCTEDGNKEYWTCEHCKKYFLSDDTNPETAKAVEQAETVIPASHKLTKVEAKDATCTEDGNKAYWTCEHCGKYFLSDDTNPETAKAVELSETVIPALIQVATTTTPIKCVYGQDMNKIDLRDYVKNTDVVGEVSVKIAAGSTLPDGIKLDGSNLSGKPAKAYEDGKEVTFTFTAENGSTENLTLLFLVEKADPTVEVTVNGDSHTEGDLVRELKLILSENSTKGVVELVSEIKALVAGKNTFTWKFTPEDENNYNMVTGTVVVNAQTTTTTTTKATTTTTKATTTTTTIPSYGDVNLDGKVDILDAVYLNRYLATLVQFSDAQIANADCYQDGVLDDQDTTALVHFIILLIDDLPVQPTEK